jgi:hypothetical protein
MSILGSYIWLSCVGYMEWSFENQVSAKSAIYETDIPEDITPRKKVKPPFIFNIRPMNRILIEVNREQYTTLLQLYEYTEYSFPNGISPTMRMDTAWELNERKGIAYVMTYVNENPYNMFLKDGQKVVRLTNSGECGGLFYKVISYEKFLEVTKITPVQILLIKEYFKK